MTEKPAFRSSSPCWERLLSLRWGWPFLPPPLPCWCICWLLSTTKGIRKEAREHDVCHAPCMSMCMSVIRQAEDLTEPWAPRKVGVWTGSVARRQRPHCQAYFPHLRPSLLRVLSVHCELSAWHPLPLQSEAKPLSFLEIQSVGPFGSRSPSCKEKLLILCKGAARNQNYDGSDLVWLWLWCRPAAIAPMAPLAWEPPYAVGAALKIQKKKKKKKNLWWRLIHSFHQLSIQTSAHNVGVGAVSKDEKMFFLKELSVTGQKSKPQCASWILFYPLFTATKIIPP